MSKMQNSKQKATAVLPRVEKYTYRGEESDNNLAGQSLNKKDVDDDEEVSSIPSTHTHTYCCICNTHAITLQIHSIKQSRAN